MKGESKKDYEKAISCPSMLSHGKSLHNLNLKRVYEVSTQWSLELVIVLVDFGYVYKNNICQFIQ